MEDVGASDEVDQILESLHDGLKKAEEAMLAMLEGIVADNANFLSELEDALSDMEAALASE
ncbi:MAG: hypothetical protein AAF467_20735 [Actinomycetota bacterium]